MNTVNPIRQSETTGPTPQASPEEVQAARFYEEKFVPALFRPWAASVIEAAGVRPGERVLDVACGTGVVTREVAGITGPDAPPVGLDILPGMLEVARSIDPAIDWRQGDAAQLPFADDGFDRVLCQYGLMFFPDRVKALAEMCRVLRPGGRLAIAVWNGLEHNPGYAEKVEIIERIAGKNAADALRAPFCLADGEAVVEIARTAGLRDLRLQTLAGEACFTSIFEFIDVDLRGWLPVMDVHLDEASIEQIHAESITPLERYRDPENSGLRLPASAHIISGGR